MKFKSADAVHENSYKEFDKLYKKYGVKLVGGGYDSKDHKEIYFMSVYDDEDHYKDIVKKLQSDSTYIELSKKLEVDREDVNIMTLEGFNI